MTAKEQLKELVEDMTEGEAERALAFAQELMDEDEIFTDGDVERILKLEAGMLAGETVAWEDVKQQLGLNVPRQA